MIQQVDLNKIKPKRFWQLYIAQRQPVVINGADKQWDHFTDDLLAAKAGHVTVKVEQRTNATDTFGQGRKSAMQFCDFLKAVKQGDNSLYMSTQEVGVGRDGHPLLVGPPLLQLQGHFPQQQPLMGNLVPQSINMWMGCAPEGSSSGLHHDYHDNLYVLLRGCKRFRLYPPSAAADMYLGGKVKKIYDNGRIVYEGQGDVLPDGSDAQDVRMWSARCTADKAAAHKYGTAATADTMLEQQLEAMLYEEAECSTEWALFDDYLDSDEAADSSSDEGHWESGGGAACGSTGPGKRKAMPQRWKRRQGRRELHTCTEGAVCGKAAKAGGGDIAVAAAAHEAAPISFSQVDLSLPHSELRRRFSRFPGACAAQEVLLQAGQMLYLPAGWFHEVTSFGGCDSGTDGGHLAVNYWYHPPDHLDSSQAGFKKPYTSPYYPTIWAQRQLWLQQDTNRWWQQQQQTRDRAAQTPQAPTAGAHQLCARTPNTGSRHIQWKDKGYSPTNRYRMSMTRQGTATGDVSRAPLHSPPADRPAGAAINGFSAESGDDTVLPCSRENRATAVPPHLGSQMGHTHLTPPQGSGECSLRHVAAPAGHNKARYGQTGTGYATDGPHGRIADDVNTAADDGEGLSDDVLAGIKAVEDYFSGNPEAARRLLQEFLSHRRQRLSVSGKNEEGMVALPRLFGRRHHYAVAVKIVGRKPGKR